MPIYKTMSRSLSTLKNFLLYQEPCDDKRRDGFFRPHSLTIVVFYLILMFIIAYFRNNSNPDQNTWKGHLAVMILIVLLIILVLPDGPLTRPHPTFWRLVFALNLIYLMVLLYILFQNHETIKSIMYWFFPKLETITDVFQTPYNMNCSDYSIKNIFSKTDVYTFGHFFGWIIKAMLVRHYGMCWLLSVTWEVTELAFDHLLPFAECWWDSIVLDILVTNGLGIFVGMLILKLFKIETYDWEDFKEEQSSKTETRQAFINFSSEARDVMESFDHFNIYVRVLAFLLFNIFTQITELNTFFQMQIFDIPPNHPLTLARLALLGLMAAPTIHAYLSYIKQDQITKLSPHCWIFAIIVILEALVNIKYEPKIMANVQIWSVVLWIIITLFLCVICMALCKYWSNIRSETNEVDTCTEKV